MTPNYVDGRTPTSDLIRFHNALETLRTTLPVITGIGRRMGDEEELLKLVDTADLLWQDVESYLNTFRLVAERVKR